MCFLKATDPLKLREIPVGVHLKPTKKGSRFPNTELDVEPSHFPIMEVLQDHPTNPKLRFLFPQWDLAVGGGLTMGRKHEGQNMNMTQQLSNIEKQSRTT